MVTGKLFPLGKAHGEAFCNRTEETSRLVGYIERGRHSFILAPRRYGKSSLCEKALEQAKYPWSKIDLHMAVTEKDAERCLVNGISELLAKSVGKATEKLMLIVKKYAKSLQPKLAIGPKYLRLELTVNEHSSPAENIYDAILILEKVLKENNKRAVLLLDEFQEIGVLKEGRAIEGGIRSAAQETQHLSIIFCGSNPHMLKMMFEDERRPLYKLCRKLIVDRIEAHHYRRHLDHAAKTIWHATLDEPVFLKIMSLTDRHPYYINYLCDELCSFCDSVPTEADVEHAWNVVLEEERSDLIKDFAGLTANQRKLMIHIANHGGKGMYSGETAAHTGIGISSVSRALESLVEQNFVEKIEDTYRLIVPAYRQLLNHEL